jgi:hypothetical protein
MPKYTIVTETSNFRVASDKYQDNAVIRIKSLYVVSTELEVACHRVGMVTIRHCLPAKR